MKSIDTNKYPHSATLFQFCKEALAIKYQGNVKVIDQDVGAILGYDPADCSHWKKGKKNVKALPTIKVIADYLNVDEKLIIDITSGKIGLEEALFEFKGYGDFSLTPKYLDSMKKEYFRNPQKWGHKSGALRSFEEIFDLRRPWVSESVEVVFKNINITEAPVYLPELIAAYPNITLEAVENLESFTVLTKKEDRFLIQYRAGEMKPFIRFLVTKCLGRIMMFPGGFDSNGKAAVPTKVEDIQENIFAANVLIPTAILRKEVEQLSISMDVVNQLSELFWVSKALVNNRLKDYLVNS